MNKIKILREINHFGIIFIFACGYIIISFRILSFFRDKLDRLLDPINKFNDIAIETTLCFLVGFAVLLIIKNEYEIYCEKKILTSHGNILVEKFIVYKENYNTYINSLIVLIILFWILVNITKIQDVISGNIFEIILPPEHNRTAK